MPKKNAVIAALFTAGIVGMVTLPFASAASLEIYANAAPPAPRHEVAPSPRVGYVWAPGHWRWEVPQNRYVWAAGFWERSRPGYVLRGPAWVQRDGRWQYQARRWEQGEGRDSDHDGIPDRRDPTPYGGQIAPDRDGDGVPDHRDTRPNDRTRR